MNDGVKIVFLLARFDTRLRRTQRAVFPDLIQTKTIMIYQNLRSPSVLFLSE